MVSKDYYRTLGLERDASPAEIRKAYRSLAMQYHPDHNLDREPWANDRLKEINEAFSVLGDPVTRRQYDQSCILGELGDVVGESGTNWSFGDLADEPGTVGRAFDVFDSIIDDSLRGTGFAFRRFRRGFGRRGDTSSQAEGSTDFETAFEGWQQPRVSVANCEIVLTREQAFSGTETELVRNGKRLKLKIPAGVETGRKIRLRNALMTTDGLPGDIVVAIRVE